MNPPDAFDAAVLLGRGGYGTVLGEQLDRLCQAVQSAAGAVPVRSAFVDQGSPSLPAALQSCAEAGARRILVQPVFAPADPGLHRWLAKVIVRWRAQWRGHDVAVWLAEPPDTHGALAQAVGQAWQTGGVRASAVTANPPDQWETDPSGWSHIPDHAYHALLCRGPRCTAKGADELAVGLRDQLKAHGLLQDDRVLVVHTGCLYPCNLGPLMVVYPDGVWYGHLTPEVVGQIAAEHFSHGQVVATHAQRPPIPRAADGSRTS